MYWRHVNKKVDSSGCLTLSGQLKIAALLGTCSREDQRSVTRLLSSGGVKPIEVHRRKKMQYGDACLLPQQVYVWDRNFKNGVSSEADADHRGRPHTAFTAETAEHTERVI
jgi:hypothetical protein